MREFGLILGLPAIAMGVMLLFAPKALVRVGEQTNKLYNIDGMVYRNRTIFGAFLIFASLFMTYTTF